MPQSVENRGAPKPCQSKSIDYKRSVNSFFMSDNEDTVSIQSGKSTVPLPKNEVIASI